MLQQNARFRAAAERPDLRPRITIALHMDDDSAEVLYFTSHDDAGRPSGADAVDGCIKSVTGGTQKIDPKNSSASIGSVSVQLADINGNVSTKLRLQEMAGRSIRGKRLVVYVGYGPYLTSDNSGAVVSTDPDDIVGYADFEQTDWLDYVQQFTVIVKDLSIGPGSYTIRADDVQRLELTDLFDVDRTTLIESIDAEQLHIPAAVLATTSKFALVEHDASYSDRPGEAVGYIKIEDEIICHAGIATHPDYGAGFSVLERGALNTLAVGHAVDLEASDDRKTAIEEYIYLEGPALKLLYALQTGVLYGQSATLPLKWHHGIPVELVRLSDYTGADPLLWNPSANTGRKLRFEGLKKTNGQQFIEREIVRWLVGYRPVYSDGAIGFRRLSSVLSDADYVMELNNSNLTSVGELKHNLRDVINSLSIKWDYSSRAEAYLQTSQVIDVASIQKYGDGEPMTLEFRGVKSTNHTDQDLRGMFDNYRNRFAGGGYTLDVEVLPRVNNLEVGDNVFINTNYLRDPLTGITALRRVFEVQQISPNFGSGRTRLSLFASTEAAGEFQVITSAAVLDDAFYSPAGGTNIASLPQYSAGVITADCTFTGGATMGDGIYYHDGDLVLGAGVTLTITDNVQIRVRGVFTRNGDIVGKGRGLPGGAGGTLFTGSNDVAIETGITGSGADGIYSPIRNDLSVIATNEGAGIAGYMGVSQASRYTLAIASVTKSGGTITRGTPGNIKLFGGHVFSPVNIIRGRNSAADRLALINRDGTLEGVDDLDLRGTSGSGSRPLLQAVGVTSLNGLHEILQDGADGGNGGAGLVIICRGESVGVGSEIDLSGDDGDACPLVQFSSSGNQLANGGGGGGQPGAYYLLIDGNGTFGTGLSNVTQNRGLSGLVGGTTTFAENYWPAAGMAFPADFGRALEPVVDFGESGYKVQYIPAPQGVEGLPVGAAVYKLVPVTGLQLESGTAQLLSAGDGSVRERIRVSWNQAQDSAADRYEVQAQLSGGEWRTVAIVNTISTPWAYFDVTDGLAYRARVRVHGDPGTDASDWLESGDHTAVGKSEPPAAPTGFSAVVDLTTGVVFTMDAHPAPDFSHYRIYRGATLATAAELTRGDFIRAIWEAPTVGAHVFWLVAYDRSNNASGAVSQSLTITGPGQPSASLSFQGGDVVIDWTAAPGSFALDEFIVESGGVELARQKATQYRKTVDWVGSKTYLIRQRDIAGNESASESVTVDPVDPLQPSVTGEFSGANIVLTWQDCRQSLPINRYTVTLNGKTYFTAQPFFSLQVGWAGNKTATVQAEDSAGNMSATATYLIAPALPAAPVISAQVIDNSVTVRHKVTAGSLPVKEFRLYIGDTFNPSGAYETAGGDTSLSILDQVASGTYTIWVWAVDSAGNQGPAESLAAVVSQPPDYVLVAEHSVKGAGWPGAKTNCMITSDNKLILPVVVGETWAQHFQNNGFSTPADQINAGFERYLQPSPSSASYSGEYDYGSVIPGSMITFASSPEVLDGAVAESVTLSYRETTGDAWTVGPAGQKQIFASSFRYVKFDVQYSAADGDDLATVEDIVLKIDKKLVKDAGSAYANAGDAGGTFVPFNLPFISAFTPSVTFATTTRTDVVVDYSAGPNPTGFYVYLYNLVSGARLSGNIDWTTNGFIGV